MIDKFNEGSDAHREHSIEDKSPAERSNENNSIQISLNNSSTKIIKPQKIEIDSKIENQDSKIENQGSNI